MNNASPSPPNFPGPPASRRAAPDPRQPRRDFLASVLVAGTALPAGLGALALGLRYVLPPSKLATAEILVCRADELAPGETRLFDILENRICLLRDSDSPRRDQAAQTHQPFKAFSLRCSHLGCFAHWEGGVRKFVCPCHNAVFDEDGQVVAGPPPVGLTRIEVEVRDQLVYMKLPYAKS